MEEIARGGMGIVYMAHQLGADGKPLRLVALKMVLAGAEATPEVIQRFWNEAWAVAGLNHPGIVPLVEAGECEGQAFYSMEFVEGGSLAGRIKEGGPLPPREAARLVRQVAEAAQAAHERGIVHRDIKPANVLVAAGREGGSEARLTDFGLARTREGGGSVTGEKLGTPSYMAPEQAAGRVREVSAATDVYGLGAVLYCLLTGRPPFQSSSPLETMRLVLEEEPVPVRQLNPSVPRDLETVCHKCLQKEPAKRYQAAGELAAELGRFLRGEPVQARPVGRLERGWRLHQRNPSVASLLSLVLLLLLLGTSVGWLLAVQARTSEQRALDEKDRADREAKEALRQKGEAERAQQRAEVGERAAKAAQQKVEFAAYAFHLRRAQDELRAGRLKQAQAFLSQCDPKLRGWEYDYLFRQTMKRRLDLQGHTSSIRSLAFSPDGKRIASGSGDRTVKVWDAQTGREALTLKGHSGFVDSVAFSPDGKHIASRSEDGTVKVWDAATGQTVVTLKGLAYSLSPNGKQIATGGWTGR